MIQGAHTPPIYPHYHPERSEGSRWACWGMLRPRRVQHDNEVGTLNEVKGPGGHRRDSSSLWVHALCLGSKNGGI